MSRYELVPRLLSRTCWSLGAARYEGDIWTCDLSPAEWRDQLMGRFDYVLLARVDDQFWTEYGGLFDRPGGLLYRVAGDGRLIDAAANVAPAVPDRLQ